MKIVFCAPHKDFQPWLDDIAANIPAAEVWSWSPPDMARALRSDEPQVVLSDEPQADYALVWAPPAEFFSAQKNLKAVFTIGAGVDRLMKLPNLDGVPIVRLNDAGMAVQMAEYVCHALIRHTREFAAYEAQARHAEWTVRAPIDRAAWPVGVMGLGSIGARVAQAVAAFDYPTFGWSRTAKSLPGISTFAGTENLEKFLQSVRVLVCVLPLTHDTENILNIVTLSRLKPPGYLINVARGAHLVEADLLALIKTGAMSGAALDVFQTEPLPPDHPFWHHPEIRITPHSSAITLRKESVMQIAAKIYDLEQGRNIEGVVNQQVGY